MPLILRLRYSGRTKQLRNAAQVDEQLVVGDGLT
jgi:hypothetical protein